MFSSAGVGIVKRSDESEIVAEDIGAIRIGAWWRLPLMAMVRGKG